MGTESAGMGGHGRGASAARRRARPNRATRCRTRSACRRPVTEVDRYIVWFHNDMLMPIITLISLFVLALLVYVVWTFNEKANPTPSKTTHNTMIEVVWTVAPVLILVFIAVPSFRLLTMELVVPPSDVTIKVTAVAMALELRLSQGRRRLQFRFLHEGEKRPEARRPPPARRRQRGGRSRQQDHQARSHLGRRDPLLHRAVVRHRASTRCPAATTRPGSRRIAKASITASARRSAARTTPSCRSRSASSARTPTRRGSPTRRRNSPRPTARLQFAAADAPRH